MEGTPRVLLVDDEPVFLDSMSKVLKSRGFEVGAVGCGVEALEELRFHVYDVVILDLKMPGMDGIAVLEKIQKMEVAQPVILLSGHAELSQAMEAMKLGAVDYILKPANVNKLCERIQACLERTSILKNMQGEKKEGG
jgi:DNA-binding NtrC family response regulator